MSSTRAADKAARLARMRHAPVVDPDSTSTEPAPDPAPIPASAVAVSPVRATSTRKPVRVTLDFAPGLYDDFESWKVMTAKEIGQSRIRSVDVLRALVRLLLSDAQVAETIRQHLRAGR